MTFNPLRDFLDWLTPDSKPIDKPANLFHIDPAAVRRIAAKIDRAVNNGTTNLHTRHPIDLLADRWRHGGYHGNLTGRSRPGGYSVTLPRHIANDIENLLIAVEGTNQATGTTVNMLRRILSDAIQTADRTHRKTNNP